MNNEIKEILDRLNNAMTDNNCIDRKLAKRYYDAIINLQKENERLKERCEYLERSNNRREDEIMSLRDECVDGETYKSRNEKATNEIQYIIDYGFDYDGLNTVESLKGLIDMLVDYAIKSKNILQGDDKE